MIGIYDVEIVDIGKVCHATTLKSPECLCKNLGEKGT